MVSQAGSAHVLLSILTIAWTACAQTWTNCNPLNVTCPPDQALGTNATFNFNQKHVDSSIWNQTNGQTGYTTDGAQFAINQKGDSPTMQSQFYIFFGQVSVIMKAAKGTGIVSSIVLQSDDLDEIDWEFLGGNSTHAQTNYFGKGNSTSFDRADWYPVDSPLQDNYHNYTTIWTAQSLQWWIDGQKVRELAYGDALNGENYPQTPMNVRLGIWAGGDSTSPGTVQWAGGPTDYSQAPYTMTVQSVFVQDFSSGAQYKYSDNTGSWQSINVANGTSAIARKIYSPSIRSRVHNLSPAVKLGIAIGAISVIAIAVAVFAFCCIRMRRAGHRECRLADAAWEKEAAEITSLRAQRAREAAERKQMNGGPDVELQTPKPATMQGRGRPPLPGGYI